MSTMTRSGFQVVPGFHFLIFFIRLHSSFNQVTSIIQVDPSNLTVFFQTQSFVISHTLDVNKYLSATYQHVTVQQNA